MIQIYKGNIQKKLFQAEIYLQETISIYVLIELSRFEFLACNEILHLLVQLPAIFPEGNTTEISTPIFLQKLHQFAFCISEKVKNCN